MMQMEKEAETLIRCDSNGIILEVIETNPALQDLFLPGEFCLHYVQADSMKRALDFFSAIKSHKLKSNVEMVFSRNKKLQTLVVSGSWDGEDGILISATLTKDQSLVEELMNINNEQTDLYRNTVKLVYTREEEKNKNSQETFEEISRLNNEVVNAQRELAKKNRELEELNAKLEALMVRDPLTKVFNIRQLKERFTEECVRSTRLGYPISLAMIDLNNFKQVNDTYGHGMGDKTLVAFAELCSNCTREGMDAVFRVGGDEFLILFINCTEDLATQILERIDTEFQKQSDISSMAFGVVSFMGSLGEDLEFRMSQADAIMYKNKRDSKLQRRYKTKISCE